MRLLTSKASSWKTPAIYFLYFPKHFLSKALDCKLYGMPEHKWKNSLEWEGRSQQPGYFKPKCVCVDMYVCVGGIQDQWHLITMQF